MVAIPPEIEYLGEGAFGGVRCEIENFSPKFLSFKGVLYDARRTKVLHCSPSIAAIGFSEVVKEIGAYAFMNCDRLRYIRFPEKLKRIGSGAFYGCKMLKEITIPESVTDIKGMTFKDCINLETATLHDGIIHIDSHAFHNCGNLNGIRLPEKLKFIGSNAFGSCQNIRSLTIPKSVETVVSERSADAEYKPCIFTILFIALVKMLSRHRA